MGKKKLLTVMGSVCLILVLVALLLPACAKEAPAPVVPAPVAPAPAPAPAPKPAEYAWKFQSIFGKGNVSNRAYQLCDQIELRSNGRIKFDKYLAQQLVKVPKEFDALKDGVIDMCCTSASYQVGRMEWGDYWHLQGGDFDSYYNRVYDLFWNGGHQKAVNEYYKEWGIRVLVPIMGGTQDIYWAKGKKPVRSFADFKGKKMACSAGLTAKTLERYGCAIMPGLVSAEYYTALQRGTVDGAAWCGYGIEAYKFGEVCGGIVRPATQNPTVVAIFVSLKSWNKLPDDLKAVIEECARDMAWHNAAACYQLAEVRPGCRKYGMEFIELTGDDAAKMRAIQREMWDVFAARSDRCAKLIELRKAYLAGKPVDDIWKRTW